MPRWQPWSRSPTRTLGKKYPAAVATWENAWDRFIPFLGFGPATRKVIYTANSIESLNYQLRKITQEPRPEPSTMPRWSNLLWLAIRSIEEKRAHQRATQTGTPRAQRKAPEKLVEGFTIQGWARVLNELAIRYPERFLQTN